MGLSGAGEWTVELWGCPQQESGQLNCGAVRNQESGQFNCGAVRSRSGQLNCGAVREQEWTVELWGCPGTGERTVELWGCPEQESGQLNCGAVREQESGQLNCCVTMTGCEQCSSTRKGNEMYKHSTSKELKKIFRNVRCKWRGKCK